jgi:hypothetical protein
LSLNICKVMPVLFKFAPKKTFMTLQILRLKLKTLIKFVHHQNRQCSFLRRFPLILLSSLKQKRWGIEVGEKVKLNGEKKYIIQGELRVRWHFLSFKAHSRRHVSSSCSPGDNSPE